MTVFRQYESSDLARVRDLWERINRDLAPEHLKDRFETYIRTALKAELDTIEEAFDPKTRNRFWVVATPEIIGTFGIQNRGDDTCELRRMYLSKEHRGRGLASRMLAYAEEQARALRFQTMLLSTAEIQTNAIRLYQRTGYVLTKRETANEMSTKTIGGGLERLHFAKAL
ncbi:MAG: GNAT family N-acetyltransferase [Pseudomonadota bacterium]